MREVRQITEKYLDEYVAITANAYPGIGIRSAHDRERLRTRIAQQLQMPDIQIMGLFADEQLQGVMKLYDYRMKLLSAEVETGGVGSVAVDLRFKKEKVARDMLLYYLRHYRERGATMATLYPFRPDFYRRMGFGYGATMQVYRIRPLDLPDRGDKTNIDFLRGTDTQLLLDCYHRVRAQTNGLFAMTQYEAERLLTAPGQHVVAVRAGGCVRGYAVWRFIANNKDNFLANDIQVQWLVTEDTAVLHDLLAFFRSQADQVGRIIIHSQEEGLYYLFHDARNGSPELIRPVYHPTSVQGVGIMYRVIDVPGLLGALADHDFNGQSLALRLHVDDSFLPENAGEWVVVWRNGRCTLDPHAQPDAALLLDVSDFSSLITGAVDFETLYRLGLATVTEGETAVATVVKILNNLFRAPRPLCMTDF